MDKAPVLVFENVGFSYGSEHAVRSISFSVNRGDFMALVGPNGGGKTTLLKLALGLLRLQEGQVRLWGQEVGKFRGWHRLGYVPQQAAGFDLHFPGTVAEVVSLGEYRSFAPLNFFRMGPSNAVRDALKAVEMWEYRQQRIGTLSIGQQQRALIARALVQRPELLILDEPTAGIDVTAQEQFYWLLKALNQERGITILLVSHDIGTVLKAVNRVACVNGTLVFHGAPEEFPTEAIATLYRIPVNPLEHRHP
ncbi:MAG: metal ABC transporter ATP-binding protein [Chloroflexi bacterium]|nr:metal ABC transporter ATP-binding protein [Chloroflexota bacterium]